MTATAPKFTTAWRSPLRPSGLVIRAAFADRALWRRVLDALDAALVDPQNDTHVARCVFNGASLAFDEYSLPYEALRWMAGAVFADSGRA